MSEFKKRSEKLVTEFNNLSTWEDRYEKIIKKGKALPSMPEELKTEESKVKGCQSQVWLHAELTPEGNIHFIGDSDALLVRGLLAVLLELFQDLEPDEVLQAPIDFIKEIGFESHLSPSRTNGFFSMIKQIKMFATAFSYLKKQKN